ncbi:MAG: hypothetical protein IPP94_18245 [Ignavibacteria bacterium]|nr:hypothetical protein [Ignavibacteria bacterium]
MSIPGIAATSPGESMHAEANIKALDGAILRAGDERKKLQTIHHSDFGSQYIDADYCQILKEHDFILESTVRAMPSGKRVRTLITGILDGAIGEDEYNRYPRCNKRFEELTPELAELRANAKPVDTTKSPHRSRPSAQIMTPASFADQRPQISMERSKPGMKICNGLDRSADRSIRRVRKISDNCMPYIKVENRCSSARLSGVRRLHRAFGLLTRWRRFIDNASRCAIGVLRPSGRATGNKTQKEENSVRWNDSRELDEQHAVRSRSRGKRRGRKALSIPWQGLE